VVSEEVRRVRLPLAVGRGRDKGVLRQASTGETKKTPAFFALGEIERLKKKAIKNSAGKEDNWRERFKSLLEKLGEYIEVPKVEPKDKMSAEEILADLESKLYKHLWENLPEEEKRALLKKYAQFKQDKTALSFMIKGELRKKFGLGVFSLFVEEK
jgi:molecular chaperone DnaK (HSP70)